MATITEDFVSFETAKLLKKKGFDEKCDKKYFGEDCSGPSYIRERWEDGGDICPMSNSDLDDGSKYTDISAPTLQMAMKWLREVHDLNINNDLSIHGYSCSVSHIVRDSLGYIVDVEDSGSWETAYYDTYEEACEEAIKYCLENLI